MQMDKLHVEMQTQDWGGDHEVMRRRGSGVVTGVLVQGIFAWCPTYCIVSAKVPAESGKNPPQSKVPKNKKKKEEGTGKINTADGTSSTKEVSSA